MNGKLFMLTLVLGLATALPTKNLQTNRTRKTTSTNNRLGIYDGQRTTIEKHNYLVGIIIEGEFYCAGVIVSKSYVLTLGYCTVGFEASEIQIVTGSSDGVDGTIHTVKQMIVHPNYDQESDSYNFALLKIRGSFSWGEDVGYATLPSSEPKNGTALVAAGYGDTVGLKSLGEGTLLQGTMNYVTAKNCASYYEDYGYINFDSSMACAYNMGKTTMCYGDYGNPLTKGRVLYGLMADGGESNVFCNSIALPVIISDVYSVVDWINNYIEI